MKTTPITADGHNYVEKKIRKHQKILDFVLYQM